MPRSGGIYTAPTGTRGSSGAVISSNKYNELVDDLENVITDTIARDGSAAWTGNQDAGGNNLSNVGDIAADALDGAVVGGTTPAAVTGTTVTAETSVTTPIANVTGALDLGEAAAPTTSENHGALYVKNDGTDTQLYYREESSGSEVQITKGGTLAPPPTGSFTPTFTFGGGNTGIGFSTQQGAYTKIGNIVFFFIALAFTAKGSSTGGAVVGGLPFTPNFTSYAECGVNNIAAGIGVVPQATLSSGADTMALEIPPTASGARAALTDAHFTNTTTLFISGQYRTS